MSRSLDIVRRRRICFVGIRLLRLRLLWRGVGRNGRLRRSPKRVLRRGLDMGDCFGEGLVVVGFLRWARAWKDEEGVKGSSFNDH